MATYRYRGKQGPQEAVTGVLEAESRQQALDHLSRQGFYPTQLEEFQEPARHTLRNSVSRKDVNFLTRQLADLLESNIALLKALEIIARQTPNPALRRMIHAIQDQVTGGKSFSEALQMFPRVFSPLYINLVYAGEVGEMLPLTVSRLAAFVEQEEDFRARLAAAIAYPLLILCVGLATILFLMLFVVPRLTVMFEESGEGLPWMARVLSMISGVLLSVKGWVLIAALGAALVWGVRRAPQKARAWVDRALLHLPFWGSVLKKSMLARFTRTLAMLLTGGVPIIQALRVVSGVMEPPLFREQVRKVSREVEQGEAFYESLNRTALFPDFVCQMIGVGEQANTLEKSLEKVAVAYERDTDRAMKLAASMLEPLMILIVGSVIGVIVVGMLLPIFQISAFVK